MNVDEKLLIDRYIEGLLTGSELKSFQDKMESDNDFNKKVLFQKKLIHGIRVSEDNRLINAIVQKINYRKPRVPFALKLIFTFFGFTVAGIVLWNYIGTNSTDNKNKYFTFEFYKQRYEQTFITDSSKRTFTSEKPIYYEKEISSIQDSVLVISEILKTQEDTEIVVKKDQFLISYSLLPITIDEYQNENALQLNDSNTNVSTQYINEENSELNTKGYEVEFWVSPVNYRGYKFQNDKLILFGIDEPDAVTLYSKEKKLWMKYQKEFYRIMPSENFESFMVSAEIPVVAR
jgi:hypothetical protein